MKNKYDLIIAGGGTAGVSCAYTAAKAGLSVLIVEKNTFLGGSITSSLVIPAMKTSDNAINTDFFNELYNNLSELGGAITYCDGNKGWFNPELTKFVLDKMMTEVNVDVLFESYIADIKTNRSKILSVSIDTIGNNNVISSPKGLLSSIETRYFVDATGDIAVATNGAYFFGLGYDSRGLEYDQEPFVKSHAYDEWAVYNNNGTLTGSFTSQFTIDEGSAYNATQETIREYLGKEVPNLIKSGVTDANWNAFLGALRTRKCDSNTELLQSLYDRLH